MDQLKTQADLSNSMDQVLRMGAEQARKQQEIIDKLATQAAQNWYTDYRFIYTVITTLAASIFFVGVSSADIKSSVTAVDKIAQMNLLRLKLIASKAYVIEKLSTQDLKIEAANKATLTIAKNLEKAEKRNEKRNDRVDTRFDKIDQSFRDLSALILKQGK